MKKRVLVYPCGTEIGLEIYRSACNSIHFELIGGSSNDDHGMFVYDNYISDLPFITDDSVEQDIIEFNKCIEKYNIDYIYPAMDGVLYKFSLYKSLLDSIVVAPDYDVAKITRSKRLTYEVLKGKVRVPITYDNISDIDSYPVFIKPDAGQGSVGAVKINNLHELNEYCLNNTKEYVISEYLSGKEYTVDCFTNNSGKLLYAKGRERKRIKNGISVNSVEKNENIFYTMAQKINDTIKNIGGWFFQLKENNNGEYVLLEVSSRIAGTSSFSRCKGVNLALMTLFLYSSNEINNVLINNYDFYELDRALYNKFKISINYDTVYVDFDDTIYIDDKINTQLISFLYQCLNNKKKIILITKHIEDISKILKKLKINDIFDKVIHINRNDDKYKYIQNNNSIFIDDSFGERAKVSEKCNINVFDVHMIECLME